MTNKDSRRVVIWYENRIEANADLDSDPPQWLDITPERAYFKGTYKGKEGHWIGNFIDFIFSNGKAYLLTTQGFYGTEGKLSKDSIWEQAYSPREITLTLLDKLA